MDINETSMLFHSWLLQPMTLIIFILVQINYLMQGVKDVWLPPEMYSAGNFILKYKLLWLQL